MKNNNKNEGIDFSDFKLPSTNHNRKHKKNLTRKQKRFLRKLITVSAIFIVVFLVLFILLKFVL
jgi:cell division septal protein FtsQ